MQPKLLASTRNALDRQKRQRGTHSAGGGGLELGELGVGSNDALLAGPEVYVYGYLILHEDDRAEPVRIMGHAVLHLELFEGLHHRRGEGAARWLSAYRTSR